MSDELTTEQLKELYTKGYRYHLAPKSGDFPPLMAKHSREVGPLMRDYPDELFEVSSMISEGSLMLHDGILTPLAALTELVNQIEGIGIEEWHGAEGLTLRQARESIKKHTPKQLDEAKVLEKGYF